MYRCNQLLTHKPICCKLWLSVYHWNLPTSSTHYRLFWKAVQKRRDFFGEAAAPLLQMSEQIISNDKKGFTSKIFLKKVNSLNFPIIKLSFWFCCPFTSTASTKISWYLYLTHVTCEVLQTPYFKCADCSYLKTLSCKCCRNVISGKSHASYMQSCSACLCKMNRRLRKFLALVNLLVFMRSRIFMHKQMKNASRVPHVHRSVSPSISSFNLSKCSFSSTMHLYFKCTDIKTPVNVLT